MQGKLLFASLAVVYLQAVVIRAKTPDWIPAEVLEMVMDDKERCMNEHGTTQDLIDKVNEGEITEDRSLSCYMFCLLDAFSMVDEDGHLETEMLLGMLPDNLKSAGTEVMNACAGQDGADGCERILATAKCVQKKVPELWFMV